MRLIFFYPKCYMQTQPNNILTGLGVGAFQTCLERLSIQSSDSGLLVLPSGEASPVLWQSDQQSGF